MKFSITEREKFKYLYKPLFIGLAIDLIGTLILVKYYSAELIVALKIFLAVLIGQSVLFYIPLLIFYWNYWKKDKNSSFMIDSDGEIFTFTDENKTLEFKKKDIKKAIFHMSIPARHGRTIILFWHDFFYAKIQTTKGDFIVTCLLCDTISEYVPEDKVEKTSSHFAHAFPR